MVGLLHSFGAKEQIRVEFEYADGLPEYYAGDAGRLRQVMLNVIGNTVKFPDPGFVHVSVTGPDERLRLCARDTGIGIAPEV